MNTEAVALPTEKKKKAVSDNEAQTQMNDNNYENSTISVPLKGTPFQISGNFSHCNFNFFEQKKN